MATKFMTSFDYFYLHNSRMILLLICTFCVVNTLGASEFMNFVWERTAVSKCWGKTQGHAFVDPDQCMPPCADAGYPKACSIAYGAAMPDCDRELPPGCRDAVDKGMNGEPLQTVAPPKPPQVTGVMAGMTTPATIQPAGATTASGAAAVTSPQATTAAPAETRPATVGPGPSPAPEPTSARPGPSPASAAPTPGGTELTPAPAATTAAITAGPVGPGPSPAPAATATAPGPTEAPGPQTTRQGSEVPLPATQYPPPPLVNPVGGPGGATPNPVNPVQATKYQALLDWPDGGEAPERDRLKPLLALQNGLTNDTKSRLADFAEKLNETSTQGDKPRLVKLFQLSQRRHPGRHRAGNMTQLEDTSGSCQDQSSVCNRLGSKRHCDNWEVVLILCPKTCGLC